MPMVEDLTQFFNVNELSHQAVLDNVEVSGIFETSYDAAFGSIGVQRPSFTLASAACADIVAGESHLRVPGIGSFTVMDTEPDGTGVTVLRLQVLVA